MTHALIHQHLTHHHADGDPHHEDESHHHAAGPATSYGAEGLALVAGERPHEHDHLDAVLIPTNRSQLVSPPAMVSAVSPGLVAAPTFTSRVARERAPPRASPEPTDPSHPRAPPQA